MQRPFLFLAGEFEVSMRPVFLSDMWSHTMSSRELVRSEDGRIQRKGIDEDLKGVVYYNRAEDYELEIKNLDFIVENNVPCWPNPKILRAMSDRHETLRKCVEAGLVDHQVSFPTHAGDIEGPFPCVLKMGQGHRGQDKFLIRSSQDIPVLNDSATVEPFFRGDSVRILIIGARQWLIEYENPDSWIKNSAGAHSRLLSEVFLDDPLVVHARRCHDLFGLQVSGVDYVVDWDGCPHFLEINQFPGLNVDDEVVKYAQDFFVQRMKEVEKLTWEG
jgi:glutathione synthase/RimK-type ligase-like ATP-grasp enzyme